ncbi:FecR domain-containing protein [Roseomonas sp. GC11]|uniref:FecR family protein n=1 Tax=Roseomonas sp. GC11 TaxID=2950546 RepID=UPI00210AB6BD|nr:FecR domain-containing protein [Roseomonas sp. GC11]MCQ4160506.1 FecR domain-containing protein [Roseomonas sp. GC11]
MTEVPEERRLFREAADLAIRLQNDPANPVSQEMVRAWALRSPRHAAAWASVAEIHGMAGQILARERQAAGRRGLSRRGLVAGGVTALSAVAFGAWAVPRAIMAGKADRLTQTAQIERIGLPDGSAITLGPDSAIAIGRGGAGRSATLLAGMAYFDIAADPALPFSVSAGGLVVQAAAAALELSNDAGFTTLCVEQGSLEIRMPAMGWGSRLGVGERLTLDPEGGLSARGTRDGREVAAWRRGMIIADSEPVSAVVARIARWQPGRVVLADSRLGRRVVSGVFTLNDPLRALQAVVRPFDARVHALGRFMTVIAPA